MAFNTAIRSYTAKRLEEIGSADILVGIPCYNNEKTIAHVIQMLSHGLFHHYQDFKSVIMISDGGSTDDTREAAKEFQLKPWQEKIVSIYRGPGGKGSAMRSFFEAAKHLRVRACAVVDSDLRSITPDWVKHLLDPVLNRGYDYVAPVYMRHKYDGTITNNIVYNLTRALYGKRIRQPIGGDFAFSADVAQYYIDQDVWDTDIARFGIDIWMTTNAITQNFKICQANLGVKIHDAKDPAQHLAPMFRQVLWTIFTLMEQYENTWKKIHGSSPVDTFGFEGPVAPEPVQVDPNRLVGLFKTGFKQFSVLYREIFSPESFAVLQHAADSPPDRFALSIHEWVRILYELAATFHLWKANRYKLIELMTPLYFGRVASFVRQSWDMSSEQAEVLVEAQAQEFENHKDYLIEVWERKCSETAVHIFDPSCEI
jgi:glycosyltransferase involved in cell wall biosynthesis